MDVRRLLCLLGLFLCPPLYAQVPDSLASDEVRADSVLVDSLRAASQDTTSPQAAVGFMGQGDGDVAARRLPARRAALEATELLRHRQGGFVYSFGSVGWPEGWSWHGMSPQRPVLTLDGRRFTNLITGRPRYDLLPVMLLDPLRIAPHRLGAPVAVDARSRAYYAPEPLTELRYWTDTDGLQSIAALHVQQRRAALFGRPGLLQVLASYGGRAADGDYPRGALGGSQLRRMRQLYGRIRYLQRHWSLELTEYYNRRHIGAHGGAEATGGIFETVYIPVGTRLRQPEAWRQTIRNDLSVTARARLHAAWTPTSLNAYWTTSTFRYGRPVAAAATDSTTFSGNLLGLRLQQSIALGAHTLELSARGTTTWSHTAHGRSSIRRLHVSLRDSFRVRGAAVRLKGAAHAADDLPLLTGSASLSRRWGALRLFAGGQTAGQPLAHVARQGFGDLLAPAPELPAGRVTTIRTGLALRGGVFELTAYGFAQRLTSAIDYVLATGDTAHAVVADKPIVRYGAAAVASWRQHAARGVYLTMRPTLVHLPMPGRAPLHARIEAALPGFFVSGRLGLRYPLFGGDLELHTYLQGRFWTAFRSRTLHPATGLLVLPPQTARTFGPSGTVDVVAEADVRAATIFLSVENFLSDSAGRLLMRGTLHVPTYPLTSWRVRFGVYWPITN